MVKVYKLSKRGLGLAEGSGSDRDRISEIQLTTSGRPPPSSLLLTNYGDSQRPHLISCVYREKKTKVNSSTLLTHHPTSIQSSSRFECEDALIASLGYSSLWLFIARIRFLVASLTIVPRAVVRK
jgi:hypothetical protein